MFARANHSRNTIGVTAALTAVMFLFLGTSFVFAAHEAGHDETDQTGSTPPAATGALLRDGVFGCSASKYANPGTLAAVGGVYVPVNDAAVTINTGYLVYKECMLDGVVSKISEAARTELSSSILRVLNTGRGGESLYVKNIGAELLSGYDAILLSRLQGDYLDTMSDAYRDDIKRYLARSHLQRTRSANQSFTPTFPGSAEELRSFISGEGEFTFERLLSLTDPANVPINAAYLAQSQIEEEQALWESYQRDQWNWGSGFYAVTDEEEDPLARQILTPSYVVSQGAEQAVTSGFRCLEGADELSEVCAPLFSGLTTQLISDTRGLSGITQAQSGLPSYVSRMVSEASAAVRQEAVNTAIGILSVARQTEALYKQAKEASANILTTAINKLRSTERTCWGLIVEKVCSAAPGADKRCNSRPVCDSADPPVCTTSVPLRVATSTAFSQAVISSQIAPLATPIAEDLQKSEQALIDLDQLITSVTDSASATNQRQALERLDTMVANNQLHNANDVTAARSQTDAVNGQMTELLEKTLAAWGDDPSPEVGWCNVNNPGVIEYWTNRWKI